MLVIESDDTEPETVNEETANETEVETEKTEKLEDIEETEGTGIIYIRSTFYQTVFFWIRALTKNRPYKCINYVMSF